MAWPRGAGRAEAKASERNEPLGIEYRVADVTRLELNRRSDVVTAIHLLHYLQDAVEIEAALRRIYALLRSDCSFVTMIANPEFDLAKHDPQDSKRKFGYHFSEAQPGNGGLLRFHPGGFEKEREVTFELRRWERGFVDDIACRVGFKPEWHDPFISAEGLAEYGTAFFANYLASPQSKLLQLTRG
ncbi:MAG TPA: class I SAM-dependent methyltransferase [Vicinamibacterales bacterium]|nr:class I SAM-dependent methyltransferase [Vicinamibacterales bacterium]